MKTLDKYILKYFLAFLVLTLVAFVIIFYVFDIIDNLGKLMDKGARLADVFLYYLTYMPFIIVMVSPIAVLLAASFTCGNMSRHREIIAIRSSGVSSLRVAFPLLIFGFIWSIIMMVFAELIVPETNSAREQIKQERIDKRTTKGNVKLRNILYRTDNDEVVSIGALDIKRGIARDVLIVKFISKEKIRTMTRAREMEFNGYGWTLKDGYTHDFSPNTENPYERFSTRDFALKESPEELGAKKAAPNEMGFFKLRDFIRRVRRAGGMPLTELTDLFMKISYPFINFIILLFGVPLTLRFRQSGMVLGFAQSITIAFIYFIAIRVGQVMGYHGTLSPLLASTIGNIIFGTTGLALLLTFRE